MSNNKIIIAAAGSGKTTYLVEQAAKVSDGTVLITTFTEANEEEIKNKFYQKYKAIPANIKIQTWFSFLLQHGVRPYQGTFKGSLFGKNIKGMLLNDGNYDVKYFKEINGKKIPVFYNETEEFGNHYFTKTAKIYSNRLSKFVIRANEASNGEVINRISRIFSHIYIDEVQDLAGYDLEILKLLFATPSTVLMAGDPRQVTYLTHHETKYSRYADGRIKDFIQEHCKKNIACEIDELSLSLSHRNNLAICNYSGRLYKNTKLPQVLPCSCSGCRNSEQHQGIFLVRKSDIESYLQTYKSTQLRWDRDREVNEEYPVFNFGESKGMTFDRVLIYPTSKFERWIYDNNAELEFSTKAKFYVAITRAKYSVAFVSDVPNNVQLDGVELYNP